MDKLKRLPTQVYIGAFQGVETASEIERLVTEEEFDSHSVICTNMAIARCDIAGKTRIRELGNPEAMEAAVSSAMLEGLLGSMSRLMIGSDQAVSRAAKYVDATYNKDSDARVPKQRRSSALVKVAQKQLQGMDKDRLAKLGGALQPGTSCIVLFFDEVLVKTTDYDEKMQGHKEGTEGMVDIISAKIKENLAKGNDIAYHIVMENGAIAATRTIEGKKAKQVRDIVLGQDSLLVNQATMTSSGRVATDKLVVTPDTVTRARTLLTSSVVAYEVSVDDEEGFRYDAGSAHVTENLLETSSEHAVITDSGMAYSAESVSIETTKKLEN